MKDWTVDPITGNSNSSEEFNTLVKIVSHIIRGSAHSLINGRVDTVARLIVAQLAHQYGLALKDTPRCKQCFTVLEESNECPYCRRVES